MRSSELDRARHIQKCIDAVHSDRLKKYSDRLKGAPATVMDNGLLQTLAFFHSKGDGEQHDRVARDLESWLEECGLVRGRDPLRALVEIDAATYRRCSEEAIAWLNWAKRLAQARVALNEARTSGRERGGA